MIFTGIKKVSLIDYPKHIACTLFTSGCNLRCPFCHNPELVENSGKKLHTISQEKILKFLNTRKRKLDGIVVTGGEPLIHADKLNSFFKEVHKKGFLIKLDTNGTYPAKLATMLKNNLIDYIAMDFKTTPDKYDQMDPQIPDVYQKVKSTLDIIKSFDIEYEIRTTVVPKLHDKEDIKQIAKNLKNIKRYVLQNFVPNKTLNPKFQQSTSFTTDELEEFKKICEEYIKDVSIRDNIH
jgi:pyruvate formate lyase activating enzyme